MLIKVQTSTAVRAVATVLHDAKEKQRYCRFRKTKATCPELLRPCPRQMHPPSSGCCAGTLSWKVGRACVLCIDTSQKLIWIQRSPLCCCCCISGIGKEKGGKYLQAGSLWQETGRGEREVSCWSSVYAHAYYFCCTIMFFHQAASVFSVYETELMLQGVLSTWPCRVSMDP